MAEKTSERNAVAAIKRAGMEIRLVHGRRVSVILVRADAVESKFIRQDLRPGPKSMERRCTPAPHSNGELRLRRVAVTNLSA